MRRHRTTARGVVLLFALTLGLAGTAAAAPSQPSAVPTLIFPVAAATSYQDDFGQPRAGGAHQGNDILAARKAPAVAVESGKIEFWTTSATAGCMLYLHGDSGTTYLYIHLNNDLTSHNDNRGKCVAGVAYAPGLKNGTHVKAGQLVGFVGDSGDANGIHPHLHFEVHPKGKAAVDPFPFLRKAARLLTVAPPAGSSFTLKLTGTFVSTDGSVLTMVVQTVASWPSHVKQTKVNRQLELNVADASLVASVVPGSALAVWTQPAPGTLEAITGAPGALTLDKVR